jgi:hypothetical protein
MLRYVVVTVPFEGHARVLIRAIKVLAERIRECEIYLVICGWPNIPYDWITNMLEDQPFLQIHRHHLIAKEDLKTSDPMIFNISRARELAPQLELLLQQWPLGSIEGIIYDFFAIEAISVARKFKLSTICSLSAFVPAQKIPLKDVKVFDELKQIGVAETLQECECLSDGLFIRWTNQRFQYQKYWCYEPQILLAPTRRLDFGSRLLTFVPELWIRSQIQTKIQTKIDQTTILLSFGTVVTDNLCQQNPKVFPILYELVLHIVEAIRALADSHQIQHLCLVLPKIADKIKKGLTQERKDEKKSLLQIEVLDHIDQIQTLGSGKIKLFITHGGCNSIREAALTQIPMWVIPFFGDQHAAALRVQELYWGHASLDEAPDHQNSMRGEWKRKSLNSYVNVKQQLEFCLNSLPLYRQSLQSALIPAQTLVEPWINPMQQKNCFVSWNTNHRDLLFGTNPDRLLFSQAYSDLLGFSWNVGKTQYSEKKCLIDQYHDCFLDPTHEKYEKDEVLLQYGQWLQERKERMLPLGRFPMRKEIDEPFQSKAASSSKAQETLWNMCVAGMRYFTTVQKTTIHFVIGPGFEWKRNRATSLELHEAKQIWERDPTKIRFYVLWQPQPNNSKQKFWRFVENPATMDWFGMVSASVDEKTKTMEPVEVTAHRYLSQILTTPSGFHMHSRIKSQVSIQEKLHIRRFPNLDDRIGFRITHPFTECLFSLAQQLIRTPKLKIERQIRTERNKVIYLLGKYNNVPFEIQLWPSLLYAIFATEHDSVYKNKNIDAKTLIQSQHLREVQHKQQDLLDQCLTQDSILRAQFNLEPER